MDPSDSEKLANYTGKVPWSYLAPHSLTGSLYFVDPGLRLEDVGAAISANALITSNASGRAANHHFCFFADS